MFLALQGHRSSQEAYLILTQKTLSEKPIRVFPFFFKEKMEGREKIESYKKGCGFLGF
jgi:hypothetical protein